MHEELKCARICATLYGHANFTGATANQMNCVCSFFPAEYADRGTCNIVCTISLAPRHVHSFSVGSEQAKFELPKMLCNYFISVAFETFIRFGMRLSSAHRVCLRARVFPLYPVCRLISSFSFSSFSFL